MRRRDALIAAGAFAACQVLVAPALASEEFDALLSAIGDDTEGRERAAGVRERFEDQFFWRFVQSTSWSRASARAISERAKRLIITCEVSSQERYEARYQKPLCPGGSSGVTIGIGYDLGYHSADALRRDWASLIDEASIEALSAVCSLTGEDARLATDSVQSVTIPWAAAQAQFESFLPLAVGATEDIYPNCADLSDDSLGALVSLVYNRGASLSHADRRREMREIRELMRGRTFAEIPAKIREMKRLWEDDPQMRGVVMRREAEALLFEEGLL